MEFPTIDARLCSGGACSILLSHSPFFRLDYIIVALVWLMNCWEGSWFGVCFLGSGAILASVRGDLWKVCFLSIGLFIVDFDGVMEQILRTPSDILEQVKQPSFQIVGKVQKTGRGRSVPDLPRLKGSPMSHHRHRANPHFVLDILDDLRGAVEGIVLELSDVQRRIQDLYLEGPLIDGWIQSSVTGKREEAGKVLTPAEMAGGYCLCGLDEFGKLWSKPCSVDELPAVGVAIARYHRLKKLLTQKQEIEQRLQGLRQSLEGIGEEYGLIAVTESVAPLPVGSGQ